MGWTATSLYYNKFDDKNGRKARKHYLDGQFDKDRAEVLKSSMVGSTYYAAVRDKKTGDIFASLCYTHIYPNDGCNFHYKWNDETVGPCENKCPQSILKLLTAPINEWAKEWRERCQQYHNSRKSGGNSLAALPVGSIIEFETHGGEKWQLVKEAPAYQFKRCWWRVNNRNTYFSRRHIPANYTVLKVA